MKVYRTDDARFRYMTDYPFLTCFSDGDPITQGLDQYFHQMILGAKNQKHITIKDAGHFVQEDKGEEWAEAIVQFIKET